MAEPILYKMEKPDGIEIPFTGTKPPIDNNDFKDGDYDKVCYFSELTECLKSPNGDPTGVKQHPVLFWKEVNINTPFLKQCCHRRKLIPKVQFYFFHSLKGDPQGLTNFLTIEMEQVLILMSKILLYDITNPQDGAKPYIEEVSLSAQTFRWKYKRTNEPCMATHGTEFKIA